MLWGASLARACPQGGLWLPVVGYLLTFTERRLGRSDPMNEPPDPSRTGTATSDGLEPDGGNLSGLPPGALHPPIAAQLGALSMADGRSDHADASPTTHVRADVVREAAQRPHEMGSDWHSTSIACA